MPDFDFFDPHFQKNTQEHFSKMQKECPFAHTDNPFDWYAVTREADVAALLKNWELWTSNSGQCAYLQPELFELDDDGAPIVTNNTPMDDLIAKAADAIEMCPAQAISLMEE